MTACVEYHAEDDLIVFRCGECGVRQAESKGKTGFAAAIFAFLKRSNWRAVMREGRKKLVCPDCQRTEEVEALVGRIANWISDQKAKAREHERVWGGVR
jgi:uncharacterized CHY-type Zn-finger protein